MLYIILKIYTEAAAHEVHAGGGGGGGGGYKLMGKLMDMLMAFR